MQAVPPYRDRSDAGRRLASALGEYAGKPGLLVLAIPRGGVPVAREISRALDAPLDVIVVRKLGLPGQEELAMGAVASGGIRVLNSDLIGELRIPERVIDGVVRRELIEVERRERAYRGDRPPVDPAARTAILVDDGLATGATMRAAISVLRQRRAASLVVAVPVAPVSTCDEISELVEDFVCPIREDVFFGIGQFYEDFSPTGDDEVRHLLEESLTPAPAVQPAG